LGLSFASFGIGAKIHQLGLAPLEFSKDRRDQFAIIHNATRAAPAANGTAPMSRKARQSIARFDPNRFKTEKSTEPHFTKGRGGNVGIIRHVRNVSFS
jgi:hypothetical protein